MSSPIANCKVSRSRTDAIIGIRVAASLRDAIVEPGTNGRSGRYEQRSDSSVQDGFIEHNVETVSRMRTWVELLRWDTLGQSSSLLCILEVPFLVLRSAKRFKYHYGGCDGGRIIEGEQRSGKMDAPIMILYGTCIAQVADTAPTDLAKFDEVRCLMSGWSGTARILP